MDSKTRWSLARRRFYRTCRVYFSNWIARTLTICVSAMIWLLWGLSLMTNKSNSPDEKRVPLLGSGTSSSGVPPNPNRKPKTQRRTPQQIDCKHAFHPWKTEKSEDGRYVLYQRLCPKCAYMELLKVEALK